MTDAYSTDYPVDVEEGYCSLCAAFGESKKRKTIRQFCECAIAAKNVIDAFLTVGRVISGLEDGEKVFRADTAVKILFLTDDNELCSVRYSIPALCEWDESDEVPFGKCVPVGEMIAVPVTGGIEVRTDVEFAFLSVRDTSVAFVKNMNILPNPYQAKVR